MTPDGSPSSMFDSSMTASNCDDTRLISVKYVWQLNDSVKCWWHPTDLRRICLTAQWQREMVMTPDWSPSNMFDSSMTASNGDDTRLISVNYVWQLNDSVKWWWHPTDLRQVCLTAQWQRQMVMKPDWSPSSMFDSVKLWWHPTDLRQICLTAQWQRQMLMTPDGSPPNMFDSSMTAWNGDDTRLTVICLTAQWQRQMVMTDLRRICLTAQWHTRRQMVMTPDWSPSSMFDSSMTASNGDDTRRISVKYVWQLNDSVKWWWHPTHLRQVCLTAQWQRQMVMTPDWSPSNMFDSSMTASNDDDTRRISAEYVWQLNDSV